MNFLRSYLARAIPAFHLPRGGPWFFRPTFPNPFWRITRRVCCQHHYCLPCECDNLPRMHLRSQLLSRLADGQIHSGEALGSALGVSRMAVWKHLRALRELGVDFEVVRGKGYRLPASFELLDQDAILAALSPQTRSLLGPLHVLLEVDSTNSWLHEQAQQGARSGAICLAELQHAGRGRHGRHWVSPFAGNVCLSLLWRSGLGAAALGGLSLAVGIAVLRCLQSVGIRGAGLKWPNDVLVDDAKLAGILIDVAGEASGPCAVIIGIGINFSLPGATGATIDQPWTELSALAGTSDLSRNRLAAILIDNLFEVLGVFEEQGLLPFQEEWRRHDVVAGRPVSLQLPHARVQGTARGIDAGGALLVETATGGEERFLSGEVSLRVSA
jgi:BirA family biotin operon repressor/biotin-[acetyl-CoA-carboxylase] ligase